MRYIPIAFLFLACNVFAVPYTLPGPGWQQLQDKTTFATLCQTGWASCDVPAGVYSLLDHSTTPVTVTDVTVGPNPPGAIRHISKECTAHISDTQFYPACTVYCPRNMNLVGVTKCLATLKPSGAIHFSGFTSDGVSATCMTTKPSQTVSVAIGANCQ